MADHPLRPATDRRLGRPLPYLLANRTSAAPAAQGPCGSPAFLFRAYAVLAWLSPGYPPPQDTFRCVTHPFATRHQGCPRAAVRLACVKHAASVQSEPGSNSSVQILKLDGISVRLPQPSRESQSNRYAFRASTSCLETLRTHSPPQPRVSPKLRTARRHARLKHKALTPIGCRLLKNGGCGGRI